MLHALGLLLSISGVFTFWISFQSLTHLFLLLLNCILYILLECVDASARVELFCQIPWYLQQRNFPPLRYVMFFIMFVVGLVINSESMEQLYMKVLNRVSSHPEYGWMVAYLLWLTTSVAIFQARTLGELVVIIFKPGTC